VFAQCGKDGGVEAPLQSGRQTNFGNHRINMRQKFP
jgi:hypothetical protein